MSAFLEVLTALASVCLAWWLLLAGFFARKRQPIPPRTRFRLFLCRAEWGQKQNLVRSHSKNRRRTIQLTPTRHASCRRSLHSLVFFRDSVTPCPRGGFS
jgi:hypothetical protein